MAPYPGYAGVMNNSVLLLSRYVRRGPSSRVRHYNFLPALEQAGFHVTVAPFLDDEYLDRFYRGDRRSPQLLMKAYWRRLRQISTARRYDLIWIEKEALPWLPAVVERAFFGERPIVIDFDDPWHLRYAGHWSVVVRVVLGRKLETMAAHAKVVTAGSPALAEWAKSSKAPCVIEIPPAVDIARYPVLPLPGGPFTIGWIGTPRNEAYLELIAEPLRRIHATHGARVRLIGGSGRLSLPGVVIDNVPWREETEAEELARCHVGVMPLLDGPWERGKCGYKLIQYMACGLPVVASPVGVNAQIVRDGVSGFLARENSEWITALETLLTQPELRAQMGAIGRRRAVEEYSLASQEPRVRALIQSVLAAAKG